MARPLPPRLTALVRKEIVWSTVGVFVEALRGADGDKVEGWPLPLAESVFMASPLLYDIGTGAVLLWFVGPFRFF